MRAANEMGGLSAASEVAKSSDGIETIRHSAVEATVTGIYSLDGKQMQQMQHGVNIVRMSDGTIKKIVVR